MRKFAIGCAAVAALLMGRQAAQADTITIGASKDATIYGGFVNNSNGAASGMFAGTDGNPAVSRTLLAFDVAGKVPAGATITGVQLTLVLAQVPGQTPANSTIELHKLLADWGEGLTGKQTPPTDNVGGTGQGFAAGIGDTTWNARFFSATTPTLWTTAGGDFTSTASASAVIGTTLNTGYNWTSNAALVADVQNWQNNPALNFGWELINSNEASARTNRTFFTRDTATPAFQPQLQITYTAVPEPRGLVLSCVAAAIAIALRSRAMI